MTTPSPILFGVERIVLACETDSTLSSTQRRSLCEQLVKKAQAVTDLPVALATDRDTQPVTGDRARQKAQLLLRVSAESREVDQGRKALSLAVTPVRLIGGPIGSAPLKSTASFVKVQDAWIVQGPVDAFAKLLGSGPRKVRKPIRSDA